VILEWNPKIVTQSLHALVTLTHPFATQFADQFRVLIKPIREDSPANTFPGFKDRDIPTWFIRFERVRCGESRETRADDDAGVTATLDVGTE
jgi:hypothetical protein